MTYFMPCKNTLTKCLQKILYISNQITSSHNGLTKQLSIAKGKEIGENFINLKIIHKMISLQASLYPLNLSF